MTYQALIFDLDGTLLDSLPDLTTSANLLRSELGLSAVSLEEVRACVGDGARILLQRLVPAELFSDTLLGQFLDLYREHLTDQTHPYEGINELLDRLSGLPMALVTNKPVAMAREILERLDLIRHFNPVIGGDSYANKKPHPQPLLEAVGRLGISPGKTLMIGDHHTDLRSARAAGLQTCFCSWGYGNDGGETPDRRVDSVTELAALLGATE